MDEIVAWTALRRDGGRPVRRGWWQLRNPGCGYARARHGWHRRRLPRGRLRARPGSATNDSSRLFLLLNWPRPLLPWRIDEIKPEWIGANLVLGGVEALSWLPARTRLLFADGATVVVEGQNAPCRSAGGGIAKHYAGRDGLEFLFVREAKRLRGIVAWVEKAGTIRPGEKLVVKLPEQRLYR